MNPHDPFKQLPEALSTLAPKVDELYNVIFIGSAILGFSVVLPMLYFVWKYHHSRGHKAIPTKDHKGMEIAWTFLPLIPLFILFAWGFRDFMVASVAPDNSIRIRVRAEQWLWNFEQPNGMRENGMLVVPVHEPVQLVMSSKDVLHSFYIPVFRIKMDVVPGMYTTSWFEATQTGEFQIFCAEYCGTSHSGMLAKVKVLTREQYDAYLKEGPPPPTDPATGQPVSGAKWGEMLFQQNQCWTCHSKDGSPSPGPTFKGVFGRHEALQDGTSVDVDENYIRESVLHPQAKIVQGFTNVLMPTFQGSLSDKQIDALISYIQTIK